VEVAVLIRKAADQGTLLPRKNLASLYQYGRGAQKALIQRHQGSIYERFVIALTGAHHKILIFVAGG
jgi:hypothetical protein